MTRVIIIDDEVAIRLLCRKYLLAQNNIIVIGECGNVNEAETLITSCKPDLILLDINLNGGSGFDLLNRFPNPDFKIIFITAFEKYALTALKLGALDYILKPIDEDELLSSIEKMNNKGNFITKIQIDTANEYISGDCTGIILPTFESLHIVKFSELVYCKSDKGYTTFFLRTGDEILVSKTIKEFEEILPLQMFLRIHQSYLVNISFISELKKDMTIILMGKIEVPLSSRKKIEVLQRINSLNVRY